MPFDGFPFQGTASDAGGLDRIRIYVYDYGRENYTVSNLSATLDAATGQWVFPILQGHVTSGAPARLWAQAVDGADAKEQKCSKHSRLLRSSKRS